MNVVTVVRALIVVLVFPASTHLLFIAGTWPLRSTLTPIFERAGEWADMLDKGFSLAVLALALRGAYLLCRRIWPGQTFRELVTARDAAQAKRPVTGESHP